MLSPFVFYIADIVFSTTFIYLLSPLIIYFWFFKILYVSTYVSTFLFNLIVFHKIYRQRKNAQNKNLNQTIKVQLRFSLAEDQRFELWRHFHALQDFESCLFDHLSNPPYKLDFLPSLMIITYLG